jgi:hypothetical protein
MLWKAKMDGSCVLTGGVMVGKLLSEGALWGSSLSNFLIITYLENVTNYQAKQHVAEVSPQVC